MGCRALGVPVRARGRAVLLCGMTAGTAMAPPLATEGHDSRFCGAKKHQGEGTCRRPAGWGTDHVGAGPCKLHGGSTITHRKAAKRKLIDRAAAKELAGLEYEPVEDPVPVLQDVAGKAVALVELIAAKAAEANDEASVGALGAALDRAHKFAESLQRLGLDERRLLLEEAQARLMWAALQRSMDAAGLPTAQQTQLLEGFEVAYAELEKANSEGPK